MANVVYSTLAPSLHNAIASHLSAGIDLRKKSTLSNLAHSYLCKYMKVAQLTQKVCLKRESSQPWIMSMKIAVLLYWIYHVLNTRVASSSRRTTTRVAHSIICLCSSNNVMLSLWFCYPRMFLQVKALILTWSSALWYVLMSAITYLSSNIPLRHLYGIQSWPFLLPGLSWRLCNFALYPPWKWPLQSCVVSNTTARVSNMPESLQPH